MRDEKWVGYCYLSKGEFFECGRACLDGFKSKGSIVSWGRHRTLFDARDWGLDQVYWRT
jgi:hypothetical protein